MLRRLVVMVALVIAAPPPSWADALDDARAALGGQSAGDL